MEDKKYKSQYDLMQDIKKIFRELEENRKEQLNTDLEMYEELNQKINLSEEEYIEKYQDELRERGILNNRKKIREQRKNEKTTLGFVLDSLNKYEKDSDFYQKQLNNLNELEKRI